MCSETPKRMVPSRTVEMALEIAHAHSDLFVAHEFKLVPKMYFGWYFCGDGLALAIVHKDNKLDLILSDINMPAMDGMEIVNPMHITEGARTRPVPKLTTERADKHETEPMT